MIPKLQKKILLVCRASWVEPIDIQLLHCTLINIQAVWIIIGFWPIIPKIKWNLKKTCHKFLELVEPNP